MDTFETHRPRLIRIAYRLLGSVAEAEDVVQETYLRWAATEKVRQPGPFLTTVVTRLSLDVLKSARVQRQAYVGQWLPDVFIDEATPESIGQLTHDLSYGLWPCSSA